jgi:predicted Rossmann-fold nucleotide-binding protein
MQDPPEAAHEGAVSGTMDGSVPDRDARCARGRWSVYSERAVIAVLGPARFAEAKADKGERQATALGATLAMAGYGVVVAGDGATATAVARGARQQQGFVLAVEHDGRAFPVADVEKATERSLFGALERVLGVADALMVLPGDVRALATLALVWSWGSEPDAPYRQVILVGEGWPETVRALADAAQLDQKTRAMVTFAPDVPEAVEALRYYIAPTRKA